MGLLNSSVSGLDSPDPIGVDLICNKNKCMSLFPYVYFFVMHWEHLRMPWLFPSFDGGMMILLALNFSLLQKFLVSLSNIIFFGNSYSANTYMQYANIHSTDRLPDYLIWGIGCNNLLKILPMACLASHVVLFAL